MCHRPGAEFASLSLATICPIRAKGGDPAMPVTELPSQLHVEITSKDFVMPEDELTRVQKMLAPIALAAESFPTTNLWLKVIFHPRSKIYHAEAKLKLPGQTIFASGQDAFLDSALRACVGRLQSHLDD